MLDSVFCIEIFEHILEAGCEEGGMADIPHGQAVREEDGAVYRYILKPADADSKRKLLCRYQCEDDAVMEGSKMLYCNAKYWNGTLPSCLGKNVHRISPKKSCFYSCFICT